MTVKTVERFKKYHKQNPHVLSMLIQLLQDAKKKGFKRWSIWGAFNVLRWQYVIDANTDEMYALSNDFTSLYSRLIIGMVPDFEDFLEIRPLQDVDEKALISDLMHWYAETATKELAAEEPVAA